MDNIIELYNKFLVIKEKNWIESKFDFVAGVGLVFEKEMGIMQNNNPKADYKEIEIKCKRRNAVDKSIRLFSASFNNNEVIQTKRIYTKYGDFLKNKKNCIYCYVSGKHTNNVNNNYSLKLNVDYNKSKIFLEIYKDGILIDNEAYWSFDLLKTKIINKLKLLAYIKASTRKINNTYYYKYENISFYKLKSFEKFLYLVETGYIYIKFQVSEYNQGKRKGQIHDHGISFHIREEKLEYLFNRIYI